MSSAIFKHDLSVQLLCSVYRAAHTIKVLGRSLASFQVLLWYGRFCLLHTCALRAANQNLVQLGNSARYTILYGLMGNVTHSYPTPRVLMCSWLSQHCFTVLLARKGCNSQQDSPQYHRIFLTSLALVSEKQGTPAAALELDTILNYCAHAQM